jgi:hypothetical protein
MRCSIQGTGSLWGGAAMSGSGERVDTLRWISRLVFAVGVLLPTLWAHRGITAYTADDPRCGMPIFAMIFMAIFASALFSLIAVVMSVLSLHRLPVPASAGRKLELTVFLMPVFLGAALLLLILWPQ